MRLVTDKALALLCLALAANCKSAANISDDDQIPDPGKPVVSGTRADSGPGRAVAKPTDATSENGTDAASAPINGQAFVDAGTRTDGGRLDLRGESSGSNPDATAAFICGPTAGPVWIEEGSTVSAKVSCRSGVGAEGSAFRLEDLPSGATYDPATATVTWKTGLADAAVYHVKIVWTPKGEEGDLQIGVADKFDDPNNVLVKNPLVYTEEFGLPVFHLQTTADYDKMVPALYAEQDRRGSKPCMLLCGPSLYAPTTVVYRGKSYAAASHYRGATSLNYPKKNYTIKFPKDAKFSEPILADGKIKERRQIALISTFDDNSYLRWRLAFELWNRIDPAAIRVEHFSAVVYLNGKYLGLYAVADKIDDNMMKRSGLAETGNVYMAFSQNGNFAPLAGIWGGPMAGMTQPRACPYEGFTKKEGMPEECDATTKSFVPQAFDDLIPFLDFVAKSDAARFRSGFAEVMYAKDYFHWWIHATATAASDTYGKNGVHYHDPKGGPWRYAPWDYNASFGQRWDTIRASATSQPPNSFATIAPNGFVLNNLWQRFLNDPVLGPMARARFGVVLRNEWKLDAVLAIHDAMVKQTAVSALRDERKWSAAYRTFYGAANGANRKDFTTAPDEAAYVRKWIQSRWEWLTTMFP